VSLGGAAEGVWGARRELIDLVDALGVWVC
jgi:hypothetical protein